MKLKPLLCLAATCILSACANTAHLTEGLKSVEANDRFIVEKPLTYVELRGLANTRWEEGLLPCIFKPIKSNAAGTFYEGEGKCVTQNAMNNSMGSPFHGGIWIPTDHRRAARLYYHFDYNIETAIESGGLLTAVILESGKGDLTFMPDIKDAEFLNALNKARQHGR